MDSSTVSVVTGVAANSSVAATKFIAAAATGSGAMLAEAIHSLVDTVNSSLMLLGIRLSRSYHLRVADIRLMAQKLCAENPCLLWEANAIGR